MTSVAAKTRARHGSRVTRQGKIHSIPGACVPHAFGFSAVGSVFLCSLRGKATAVEDPASVTDEVPARASAGRDGPVDSGLPFLTSSIFRMNGRNQRTVSPVLFFERGVNGVRLWLEFSAPA